MCLPGTIEAVRERAETEELPRLSRGKVLAAGAGAALAAAFPAGARAAGRSGGQRVQDLTHLFRAGFPMYTGDPPARRTIRDFVPDGFYAQEWTFGEHSGTHMDAPGHFFPNGRRTPQLAAAELIVPIAVVDVSARVPANPDTAVTVDDLRAYERRHGRIRPGTFVAMYSGWESRVGDAAAYRNADASGTFHFPGFSEAAVDFLLDSRDISGIGVDTLSLDPGNSTTFGAHVSLLGADRYGLENLANLSKIPARGATATVGVIPWEQGSGGPARVIATWNGDR
jgi:kynurenine formamidase